MGAGEAGAQRDYRGVEEERDYRWARESGVKIDYRGADEAGV